MKLYYMKGACSLASYISLNETGLKFEAVEIDHATRRTRDGEILDSINTITKPSDRSLILQSVTTSEASRLTVSRRGSRGSTKRSVQEPI